MAEDIRLSVGADTTQMESQIANAARKATVVIRPTIDSKGLEKISAPLGRITGQADEFSKSMEAANARVLAFGASVGVLNAVAKSFQNIVTASTQVEASLKEIQVATGETSGNLEKLGKGIFEVARSTGLSFKQASEATLEFARQGGTLEDSLMKAKAALVLTRTTGLDAAEAVKGLTAAVLSFNQVGLDYETVVNKLAAVDTKFAVSSRDLIEGISRSASVAQEAGVSFDELTALITTLQEKTARGGAVIGNALKTIFQRVQTTENLDYIRNLGIAVNDVSGDILPATTIIKKLADEFQNLDSATRKGLLIKIGGGFQIDKLAALLNDISSANGTFNRSLAQSTNAGNQGFQKLDELNKTVQASFDRLTTSGSQFAATIGKIAFSDDFRSILNKTSSFLESLNESISGGEEGGATIGKSIVKGIGSVITGPGALLLAGLGIKLFGDLAKFGVDSLKNQLGVTNVKKEQQDIEKSILGLLLQNTAVQTKIVSLEGNKAAQAEYLLGLYSKQAATLERMSKLSKDIGPSVYEGGIRLTTEGTKNVNAKTAASGYMPLEKAIKSEKRNAPAGSKIILDKSFPMGGGEVGPMVYNSSETRVKNFANGGDAIIPNFANPANKPAGQINTQAVAGLTIGGAQSFVFPRAKELSRNGALTNVGNILQNSQNPDVRELVQKFSSIEFGQAIPVGNIYKRVSEIGQSEDQIVEGFRKNINKELSPKISKVIEGQLKILGIEPTKDIAAAFEVGRVFNLVGKSEAGLIFENMLKIANLDAKDIAEYAGSDDSPFDIYNLKPDIAKQMLGQERGFDYVEVRSQTSALSEALTTKYLNQLMKQPSKLLPTISAKTAAEGYVPNFAGTTNVKGVASRFNAKIGEVYKEGDAAIRGTFDNPKTALRGTLTGQESRYDGNLFGIKLDESSIVASILGNNMFFGPEDKRQDLTTLAVRSSAQGATKGKSENLGFGGLSIQKLAAKPENVITSTAQGKFKKIDYTKLGKVLPRFWKSKGLGEVWEKTKIAAAKQAGENSYFSNYSDIVNARPDLREFLNNPNAIRDNNKILRDSVVESVKKKDPNIAGFFVDLIGSEERQGLGFSSDYVNYLMPFNASPLSDIKSRGAEEDVRKQKEEERKINETKKRYREQGLPYREFVNNKSKYLPYGQWGGNNYYKNGTIYLRPDVAKNAAKGYIPNFSRQAVLDAIGREQKESGLPLSAIKVVQDSRVQGPQNPNGYAVINNRDEPNGKVPNFAMSKEDYIKSQIESFSRTINDFNEAVAAVTKDLIEQQTNFGQIAITQQEVAKIMAEFRNQTFDKPKINRAILGESVNSALKSPDSKGTQVEKEKTEAQEKQTKTVQDSLYTLLKWQTVLSFASGGISAFGEKTSKVAEALSSFGTTVLSLTEGQKAIKSLAFGKEDANILGRGGALNKVRSATTAGYEANGLRGAAAGFAGAGGARAIAGAAGVAGIIALGTVEALKGLDSTLELFDGSIQRSADTMDGLAEMQKKFGISLSESQKRIIESSSSPIGSGRGIAGFFNQKSFLAPINIFTTKLEDELTKTFGKTGLNEAANKQLYSTIAATREPIIEQRLKQERADQLKKSGKEVPSLQEIKIPSALIQQELQKETKDVFEFAKQNVLQKYKKESDQIKVPTFTVDDLSSPIIGGDTKTPLLGKKREPKYKQKNIEDVTSDAYKRRSDLLDKINKGEADNADVLYELQDLLEQNAKQSNNLQASAKLIEESFLYSSKYLAIQLSTSAELLKIQSSIASSEENLLKFKKDNIQTSEAEKILIDYKLQKLESERNLRSDIQQAVLKGAEEEVNAFKNRKGNVTPEEADLINKLYENLAKAAAEGQNVAEILNQFVIELNNVDTANKKFTENLAFSGKGLQLQVNTLKERSSVAQEESRRGQLLSAINAKISYEYNAQKQFLMDKIAIQQKGLDIAREEAGLARNIRDRKFDISLIGKTPRQQQIAQLQRQASGIARQDELKDLQNTRSQAALTARSKLIQSILEKDTTVNPQDLENLSQQELKTKFISASTLKGTQLDTTVDQLSKGGDIFQTKVGTAGDIVISKLSDAGEALAKKLGVTPVEQPSTFGTFPQGLKPPEKGDSNEPTEPPKVLPAQTETDLGKAREMAKNAQSRAEMEYNRILSESALPRNKEESINIEDLEKRLKALNELDSITTFSGGMRQTMASINDEVESFGNTLGKEIPMNFRNGLVDAMKALSDPNATTSLKERLMGVAGAFLNKINEALMMQTANKITRGIFGDGTPGTGLAGSLGFASGGPIEGGSGTKDDVPAMLMGGEYVIRKNVVNKYGKDFFDRLNAGKVKGFANGGLATFGDFQAADVKDTVINPTNYVPYGETKMGGLSFDENGRVIGMDSYTGNEQGKQNALMQAQTSFYSNKAQSGEGGFFMPGKYGQGAIIGQQNLLSYASQDTIGTQFDKFSGMGNMAGIDIAGGSANLSLSALRDQGNIRNAEYIESKNKALDLYLGGIGAEKEKYAMDEENRKQYEQLLKEMEDAKKKAKEQSKKQMQGILIQAGISLAMAGIGGAMSKGWNATNQASGGKASFMQKLGGAFTGGTMTNAAGTSETRGGLFNMFSSSGYKDFSVIGNPAGGLQQWNSGLGKYTSMDPYKFSSMYQPYQDAGRLSYDAFGSPIIGGPLRTGPSSGFNFSNMNPMNWFSGGKTRSLNMNNMGYGSSSGSRSSNITLDQAFPSAIGSGSEYLKPTFGGPSAGEVSWSPNMGSSVVDSNGRIIRYAAGGTVQGNGMGDNVPAMLNGGEFVMSKQASQKIGYNNLQQMNSNPQDSGSDITSRIEAKLEELFDKVSGVGTINISVSSDGKDGKKDSEESSNQDQQNKELARKMKEVVLNVLRDEKRLGGLLR